MMLTFKTAGCRLLGVLFLVAISAIPLHPQGSIGAGTISGKIAGVNGSPVAGATVILRSDSTNAGQRRTETDGAGHYAFTGIPFGAYKLSASAAGFRDSGARIVILDSANAEANLILTPVEGGQENSKDTRAPKVSPPAFSIAGARGTTAPSGYSAGLSAEETAHVKASVAEKPLFDTLRDGAGFDCSQEPSLLREVENTPHSFAANHALGAFYLEDGDYINAIRYLSAAHSSDPADFANLRDLALALIGGGRGPDAVALLQPALRERQSDSKFLRLLALAYRSAGDKQKAADALRRAAAVNPDIENQYGCGIEFIQLGDLREALDLFDRGTIAHADSEQLWFGLGIAEHLLGDKQKAVSALFRSAEIDPDFVRPLVLLAELSGLSDPEKSELHDRIARRLTAHPENAEAHFAYALLLSKQTSAPENTKSRQEIVSHVTRALQLNPRMAQAYFLLGEIEAEANNLSDAIDRFVAGLEIEPGNAEAHYRLSLLYRRTGRQEAAHKEMDIFRALHGDALHGDHGEQDTANTGFSVGETMTQAGSVQRRCGLRPETPPVH